MPIGTRRDENEKTIAYHSRACFPVPWNGERGAAKCSHQKACVGEGGKRRKSLAREGCLGCEIDTCARSNGCEIQR
jgi:hypothetical protein